MGGQTSKVSGPSHAFLGADGRPYYEPDADEERARCCCIHVARGVSFLSPSSCLEDPECQGPTIVGQACSVCNTLTITEAVTCAFALIALPHIRHTAPSGLRIEYCSVWANVSPIWTASLSILACCGLQFLSVKGWAVNSQLFPSSCRQHCCCCCSPSCWSQSLPKLIYWAFMCRY